MSWTYIVYNSLVLCRRWR